MGNILLVEDSTMLGRLAKQTMEKHLDHQVFWVKTMKDAQGLLAKGASQFSMALLDYNLPDAPQGEIIDAVVNKGITTFVFTSDVRDDVREYIWSKRVADYIPKDSPNCLDYIVSGMRQLQKNRERLVLVVDDSQTFRTMISELLYIRQYRVVNAADGEKALNILEKHPEISFAIVDYNMPGMDGCELSLKIREIRKPDVFGIIGMSSEDDATIGARFIKSGADDFIVKKSFLVEEFYTRVDRCARMLEMVEEIRLTAQQDFLTGLYNRRFFFSEGAKLFSRQQKNGEGLCCAMIDIDHFKRVNDTYGHDVGDAVIKTVGSMIEAAAGDNDIVARFGGEEFCVLSPLSGRSDQVEKYEKLRQAIENSVIAETEQGDEVRVTCSTGLCLAPEESLEAMITLADGKLYEAKRGGRNRVEF